MALADVANHGSLWRLALAARGTLRGWCSGRSDQSSVSAPGPSGATSGNAKVALAAIREGDLDRVGRFLHEHLNRLIPGEAWAKAADPSWMRDAPNHGFMLVEQDRVVGVHLAFYSERTIDGRTERFCDLAAWCVLETHRAHGMRLLRALLAQPGFHFTDLSPSGNVVPLNERLRFKRLDTTTRLYPNLPWPNRGRTFRIIEAPSEIAAHLSGADLQIFRDHAGTGSVRHLLVSRNDEVCHVMFRLERRKKRKLFALILHVGNPSLFRDAARHVFAHLLLRHGALFTLVEWQVVDHAALPGIPIRSARPRMYRSDRLMPEQIDYLYSELTRVEP